MNKVRPYISLGVLIFGVIVSISGIIMLFRSPAKAFVEPMHDIGGIAFIVFMIIHTVLNWKPMKNYIVDKAKAPKFVMSRPMSISAAVLVLFLVFGSVAGFKSMEEKIKSRSQMNVVEQTAQVINN